MSSAPIIFDVTRLVTRLGRLTPNGIDRVDLDYARYLAGSSHDVLAAIIGPDGAARLAPRRALVEIVRLISDAWAEEGHSVDTSAHNSSRARRALFRLHGEGRQRRTGSLAEASRLVAKFARLQWAGALFGLGGLWPGRGLATSAPDGAVYLNVSQFPIWRARYLAAFDRRPDVRCYFMLHDLLPIRYPEFFRPFEVQRHLGRLETIAMRASGVIMSSEANKRDLMAYFHDRKIRVPNIIVAPLSVAPVFQVKSKCDGCDIGAMPPPAYFVCVGTIEPRKNHLFLLHVWRELIAKHDELAPDLILVGSKGWQFANVMDMLERCPSIQRRVRLVSGLSTPALVSLLRGAKALLMPTFAEGYGLPVAEALQSGVPVIASDIEAFSGLDASGLTLVDATDGVGWIRVIMEHLHSSQAACGFSGQLEPPNLCQSRHIEGVIDRIAAKFDVHSLD